MAAALVAARNRFMAKNSGLTIRQFERREIDLPVEFVVGPDHRAQVTFSPTSGVADQHAVQARSIDFSSGGVGLRSRKFIPRGCRGTVRVFDPTPVDTRPDGTPVHEVMFEHAAKVRRVDLIGHEPTYFVGVSFVDAEGDLGRRIAEVLAAVSPEDDGAFEGGEHA